jgi:UDP:flavonoid glycosyltransferase YjiC (YdhE family)
VAAGTLLALGARVAQEHLGLRYASVGFAPSVIRSVEAPPRLPYLPWLRHAPRAVRAGLLWLLDTAVADPLMAPPVNALRTRLGLPPVRGIIRQWWYSPTLNLCLWPAAFGARQNDWPAHSVLTGFPLWDESSDAPLPPDVAQFLAQPGGAPIVFTPGSAMRFGQDFFEAAVGACQKLQRRGLLLTRYPEQLPSTLPGGVMHAAYAPFSQLLPHTAALVHHGGIGTTSQALGAGVPQLVMPMAHDQFDNADRVKRLGLGDWLPRHRFSAANVAARLQHVLGDAGVAAAAQRWSHQQSQAPDGCDAAARVLEALMAAPVCTRSASVV